MSVSFPALVEGLDVCSVARSSPGVTDGSVFLSLESRLTYTAFYPLLASFVNPLLSTADRAGADPLARVAPAAILGRLGRAALRPPR